MKRLAFISLLTFLGGAGLAVADQLPVGAAPVGSAELRKIYAGKSAVWGNRDAAYFAASGKVKVVFTNFRDGQDRWTGYATGSWSVKGNRMCWNVSGASRRASTKAVEPFSGHVACWEWFKAGSKYYTRWSQKWRSGRGSSGSGYNTSALSKIRSGDAVSGWYSDYVSELKR